MYAKEVIALRKQNPALRRGDYRRLWSVNGTYAFSRSLDGDSLVIALNASESPQEAIVAYETKGTPTVLVGEAHDFSSNDGRLKFKLPARSGVVLK
jgi:hypothetical protein